MSLFHGDCLPYMKACKDKQFDCVITDPPYGIGAGSEAFRNGTAQNIFHTSDWDKEIPSQEAFLEMQRISKTLIIWGGNYFAHLLPPSRCWLVWDKKTGENSYADCELAYTNIDGVVKKYSHSWIGANAKDTPQRLHPTQKPVSLIAWVLENYTNEGETVFDPYMGSGTVGVACVETGRLFTGCEISAEYFAIAEKRIKSAVRKPKFFTPANNRVHWTGGESAANLSLFPAEVASPAKVTRKSPRQ